MYGTAMSDTNSDMCTEVKYLYWQYLSDCVSRALLVREIQNYLLKVWWAVACLFSDWRQGQPAVLTDAFNMYCTYIVNSRYSILPFVSYRHILESCKTNSYKKKKLNQQWQTTTLLQQFPSHQNVGLISSMSHEGLLLIGYTLTCSFKNPLLFLQSVSFERGKCAELSRNVSLHRKRQQKLLVHLNVSATEQERVHSAQHFRGEMRFENLTLWQDEGMIFPELQHNKHL